MPISAPTASPESEILREPVLNLIAPDVENEIPSVRTRMRAAISMLRPLPRSTWLSTRLRTPTADIIPYRMNETPPMVAAGIVPMNAENLGQNETSIAMQAAMRMTRGSYTRESERTPVFSPYVVFAGAPKSEARHVASPSPSIVRWSPGSAKKFFFTVEDIAETSPTCSMIVANASGNTMAIALRILPQSGWARRGNTVFSILTGRPIHAASATLE